MSRERTIRRGGSQDAPEQERTPVFVSYSRRDKEFVEFLQTGLEGRHLEVWLDRDNIPPAADWREEISDGIEGCEALIVVVSPDSSKSEEVAKEIDRAEELGKRIVPVLHRDVGAATPPHEAVAARNWVLCLTDDAREEALDKIDISLRIDPQWTKEHTRLNGLALVWERRERDKANLVRGADLDEAEAAIVVERPPEQPQVTELMREFVTESRRAAVKRQRRLVITSLSVAAVAITLAVVAILARFEADRQRAEAVRQRDTAVAAALASQSGNRLATEPDLAALLALEAFRTKDTVDARGSLLGVVDTPTSFLTRSVEHTAPVLAVTSHEPSGRVATADGDGRVVVWDLPAEGGGVPSEVRFEAAAEVSSLAFDDTGARLFVATDDDVQTWDVSAATATRLRSAPVSLLATALSPDGSVGVGIGTLDDGGAAFVRFDTEGTGDERVAPLGREVAAVGEPTALAISEDSSSVAVGIGTELYLWRSSESETVDAPVDLADLDLPDSERLALALTSVTIIGDGSIVALGTEEGAIYFVRVDDEGSVVEIDEALPRPSSAPLSMTSIRVSDDAADDLVLLTSGHNNGEVKLWFVDGVGAFESQTLRGHDEEVRVVTLTSSGTIASGSFDGDVIWSTAFPEAALGRRLLEPGAETSHGFDVSDVEFLGPELLVSLDGAQNLLSWDPVAGTPIEGPAGEGFTAMDAAGELLATGRLDGTVAVANVATGTVAAFEPVHEGPVVGISISQDQTMVLSVESVDETTGEAWLWDIAGERRSVVQVPDDFTMQTAAFPERGVLWIAGELEPDGGDSEAWALRVDTSTGMVVERVHHNSDEVGHSVQSIALSPDGSTLATGGSDRRIFLWDTTDLATETAELAGHLETVSDIVFVTNDVMLASDDDRRIFQWDVEVGRIVGELSGPGDGVTSLALHPDGEVLAAGSEDDIVWTWDLQLESWIDGACDLAGRNLSGAEWTRFRLSGDPVRHCPGVGPDDVPLATYPAVTAAEGSGQTG